MKAMLLLTAVALFLTLPAAGLANDNLAIVDGELAPVEIVNQPAQTIFSGAVTTIDVVGSTANPATGAGRAKGNSYRVDIDVELNEAEFYLTYSGSQTLTFYVFDSPVEFGTYTEIYRDSQVVTGTGAGWYSSGPLSIPLYTGMHYIIAVSWNGTVTYYYDVGDEQATSFGAHTHGYATGYDPLPGTIESNSNDQAIYHQRLTTDVSSTPVEDTTWGSIRALYR